MPLFKLSTVTSKQNQPIIRGTNIPSKETASQTVVSNSTNSSTRCVIGSERTLTYSKPASTTVDFSAQYNEARDASCQTGPSLHSNRQRHEPAVTISSQGNSIPSNNNKQFNSVSSSYHSHFNEVPYRSQSHFNGVPYNNQFYFKDVPYTTSHPVRFHAPDLEEHSKLKTAWREQSTQSPLVPFPLLHISNRTQSSSNVDGNAPPFTGYPPYGDQTSRDNHPFPLLNLPKQASAEPTKTFRLFQTPPASRDLPLLQMTRTQEKKHRPDLSKIKFSDITTTRDPRVMLQKVNVRSTRGPRVLSHEIEVHGDSNLDSSPMFLLHIPKEKSKPKLVPAAVLEAHELTKRENNALHDNKNVKRKKILERKRKRQRKLKEEPFTTKDVRDTPSRQRRRQKMLLLTHSKCNNAEKSVNKLVQVKPIKREKEMKSTKPKERRPPPQLEEGISEESQLELSEISQNFELSEEGQLYFNVHKSKTAVSSEQVDEYCRELEARAKKQFEKEMEALRKQQMELEVKERVRKEMEKQREQDEERNRLEQERQLHERLERERKAREDKLQEQERSPCPVPRKRSVKWGEGSFVCYDDKPSTLSIKSQSSVEVQVQSDVIRTCVDQITQTTEPDSQMTEPRLTGGMSGEKSFVPVLPPDVLLCLRLHEDINNANEMRDTEIEADLEKSVEKESARQFLSVADIDSELWEKIRRGNKMTSRQDEEHGRIKEEEELESEVEDQVPSKESPVPSNVIKSDDEELPKKHDPLTVRRMESSETPKSHTNNASSLSKERLSSRLREMNERFEAIEKITQNMDREFHSSNVLLNAIESIGEIMSPAVKEPEKKFQGQGCRSTLSREKRDKVPWRRDALSTECQLNTSSELNTRITEVSFNEPEHKDTYQDLVEEQPESDDSDVTPTPELENKPSGQAGLLTESHDHSRDQTTSRDQLSITNDLPSDSLKASHAQNHQTKGLENDVLSVTSRSDRKDSLQDMKLSSDKLEEIFANSHDSSKSRHTANKRKKVQEWMAIKRKERHLEWKKQVDELRGAEFKPFSTGSKGPSNITKIKLAEKERETKRRTRQESQIDERIKEASNLINEMLAEPVPRANILRNLHYASPNPKSKAKHNNRYNTTTTLKEPNKKTMPMSSLKNSKPDKKLLTGSPLYSNKENRQDSRLDIGARSVTPSGSDFVTTKTYRTHEKGKIRRSRELEREIKQQPNMDANGLYTTDQSINIDDLIDQIPDGSTIDGLNDIDELLSDDSELKELLTDVLGSKNKGAGEKGVVKKSGAAFMGTVTFTKNSSKSVKPNTKLFSKNTKMTTQRSLESSNKRPPKSSQNNLAIRKPQNSRYATKTTLSRDVPKEKKVQTFDDHELDFDEVSPWSGDSLRMSENVAQLLAEAKEAIGDNMSESSGSIMSNIDWEAVDKIMNDM